MKYTILVNKENKIKESYFKHLNLVSTKLVDDEVCQVEEVTYQAYLKLKEKLLEQGIEVGLCSAYRSLQTQQEIYDEFVIKYGVEYASATVAPVGTSEHHTGLALDLALKINGSYEWDSQKLMSYEKTYQQIHSLLKDFGFILRYPKDKEEITDYPYEPWHIRYVGLIPAQIISSNHWTLEEYLTKFSTVLYINKEKGKTSFDMVHEISNLFGIKRVGHTGTLDPLAEGVLLVTVGQATKIAELLTAEDKEYEAGVLLGVSTDTLDITGNIIKSKSVVEPLHLEQVLKRFQKTYLQEVPIYSAVKVQGKKLYEYARNNQQVELPKKEVTIKKIELLANDKNTFIFKALVTKGCYIRSLIADIGKELNTYATMTTLTRTKQGSVSITETNTLAELKQGKIKFHSIEEVVNFPTIEVSSELEAKIKCGIPLENTFAIEKKVLFKNRTNQILGIYEYKNGKLRTWKNFR